MDGLCSDSIAFVSRLPNTYALTNTAKIAAAQRLNRRRFTCPTDAQMAWEDWKKRRHALHWWNVEATLGTQTRRRRRAGGGPLETVTEWVWTVRRGAVRQNFVDQERVRRRTLVLVSNATGHTAQPILEAYNGEHVVETSHATVKGPLCIAPVFLKDLRKITAYVYVVYLAELLWAVIQAVARRNAELHGVTLPYPNQPLQDAPTTKRIKELLTPVTILRGWSENVVDRSMAELTWVQRLACLLVEVEPRSLMEVPAPSG